MIKNQIRQGDVLLTPAAKGATDGLKKMEVKEGRFILAYGEATGHHHSILADDRVEAYIDNDGNIFLDVREETLLEHQEHTCLPVLPGVYEYRPQYVVDLLDDSRLKRVID